MKNTGSSSITMAVARIVVGIMFLFFAQYKLMGRDFAHGGYEKYVTGYVQESSVSIYKPFLRATLKYPGIGLCGSRSGVAHRPLHGAGIHGASFCHYGRALHVEPAALHLGAPARRAGLALFWQ
jgi:hypothetical protein